MGFCLTRRSSCSTQSEKATFSSGFKRGASGSSLSLLSSLGEVWMMGMAVGVSIMARVATRWLYV